MPKLLLYFFVSQALKDGTPSRHDISHIDKDLSEYQFQLVVDNQERIVAGTDRLSRFGSGVFDEESRITYSCWQLSPSVEHEQLHEIL